jgi:hypothetical protein
MRGLRTQFSWRLNVDLEAEELHMEKGSEAIAILQPAQAPGFQDATISFIIFPASNSRYAKGKLLQV